MRNSRPVISLERQPFDTTLDVIAIVMLLFVWLYPAMEYANLPDTIPVHFNAKGEADDWGSKIFIWFIPGITTLLYALITYLNRFPHLHNYMVNITTENAKKNYQLSTRVLRFSLLFVLLLMAIVTIEMVSKGLGKDVNLIGVPFLIFSVVFPLIGIIIIYRQQQKINR